VADGIARWRARRPPLDRLTVADLMMLRTEEFGWRQDIGAIALLDPEPPLADDGSFRLDVVRERVAARLHLVPRFRKVLHTPAWGLGGPLWIDAPDVDLSRHVRLVEVPTLADDAALLAEVEQLRIRPFDPTRPLWEMWLLRGADDGRVAIYVKLHHAMADGMSGLLLIGAFLDTETTVTDPPAPPWTPATAPSSPELLVDNVSRWAAAVAHRLRHPIAWYRELREIGRTMRVMMTAPPAPETSVNQPIGDGRHLVLVRGDLDLTKWAAHEHGAAVNDVLLAAVAGGYRDLLMHRGEPVDGVELRANVPVSLHDEDAGTTVANHDGMMFAPLPVGVADAAERLESIGAQTAEAKHHAYRPPSGAIAGSRVAMRAMWRRFDHQRWSNAYVADVPGPPVPLHLAGARVLEVFPVVPIMGNLTIGVGALSYAGQFNITVVADTETCPDVDVFANGLRAALRDLEAPLLVDR
jgi:WS/DGAT/MGAT family acyltransferase